MKAPPRTFDERLADEIGRLRLSAKAESEYKLLAAFFKGREAAIMSAMIPGLRLRDSNGVFEFEVPPHASFKAKDHVADAVVEIHYWSKSGRFTSPLASSGRIGILDLLAHVWSLHAPDVRAGAEVRLLALIGQAFLHALAEGPPLKSTEAA